MTSGAPATATAPRDAPPRRPFGEALAAHPVISRLGDVAIRYEPSLLVGETARGQSTAVPSLLRAGALAFGLGAVALLASPAPAWAAGLVLLLAAAVLVGAGALEARQKRRRAFILNFLTASLRLDFVTPFAGRARTLVVSFDAVRAVTVSDQGGGYQCLTVDFAPEGQNGPVLREVLAAFIPEGEGAPAQRLRATLEAAFGLGQRPAAPAVEVDAPIVDSFLSGR